MVSKSKNISIKIKDKENGGNAKLTALILKKGKRDVSGFKKAFGINPDFPSIETIRAIAWK